MVFLKQLQLFVELEPQLLQKPAQEILDQAQQAADEDGGVLTCSTVDVILGKEAADVLYRKAVEEPSYRELAPC